ncbi:MAG: diol dehydratase small subunit [Anaerolineales bacterium]|nr:diol dehydratase small subunit [Anaerolineales bacterium]
MNTNKLVHSASGRNLDELNLESVLSGELTADDFRISRETLMQQADAAWMAGYRQLATNLRRAAELTAFTNQELLDIYTLLRPGRSSYTQLITLADQLENQRQAPLIALFIREATKIYQQRGIIE